MTDLSLSLAQPPRKITRMSAVVESFQGAGTALAGFMLAWARELVKDRREEVRKERAQLELLKRKEDADFQSKVLVGLDKITKIESRLIAVETAVNLQSRP